MNHHHWAFYEWYEYKFITKLPILSAGVHIFLTHNRYVNKHESPIGYNDLLETLKSIMPTDEAPSLISIERLLEEEFTFATRETSIVFFDIDLNNEKEKVIPAFARLREAFVTDLFVKNSLFLVLPFWAWDVLHDRRLLSVADYHEYLCWDGNNLISKSEYAGQDHEFFQGSSFHALTEQKHYPSMASYTAGELDNDYETALLWLENQDKHLAQLGEAGQVILKPAKPNMHYLRVLTSFLPPFWEKHHGGSWIPSNPGNWGGPLVWKDLWELDMHTRHLLLDGWLSLWPDVNDPQRMWLQPASLSLMYWAARRTRRPHTDTPQTFLENYQWDDARWFGGRWQKCNDKKGG